MSDLRQQTIEAIGVRMFPTSRGGRSVSRLAELALDGMLDCLQANAGMVVLDFENSISLADEVALSGLGGLIAALRSESR